jgi:hypothetical protein
MAHLQLKKTTIILYPSQYRYLIIKICMGWTLKVQKERNLQIENGIK